MFEHTKALLQHFLDRGVPGFDLLVLKDGKELFRHMGGYMDLEKKIPVKGDELYNIYSCSKPITVTAAMQLWEKGLFDLEDELSEYLPEYKEMTVRTADGGVVKAQSPILVRQIFTMSAGFSYDLASPKLLKLKEDTEGRCPTREFSRYLAQEPLYAHPGTEYRYSLCHDVLAALVEVISGEKFETYVKKNVFDPMGMTRSDFLLPMDRYDEVATLYRWDGEKPAPACKVPTYRLGSEHASGGAGCVSTMADYIKFAEGLRTCTLLKKETIDLIAKPWLNESENSTANMTYYDYGLGMRKCKPGTAQSDFGWGGAAGASLHVDIPNGISMYYAQHMLLSPTQSLRTFVYIAVLKDLGYDIALNPIEDAIANQLTY